MDGYEGWGPEALARVKVRMQDVDNLPEDLRLCVYEYGQTMVNCFLQQGIRNAKTIHSLVRAVREGSMEIGMRTSASGVITREPHSVRIINDALQHVGLPAVGRHVVAELRGKGRIITPAKPSPEMVAASISALDDMGLGYRHVPREEKHRHRLRRALAVAARVEMGETLDAMKNGGTTDGLRGSQADPAGGTPAEAAHREGD